MANNIEVKVPDDIMEYKESLVAGLSARQLLWGGIALSMGVGTFFLLKGLSEDIAVYATMIVVAPAFCMGFIKPNGYKFEIWLKIKLYAFLSKTTRTYEIMSCDDTDEMPIEVEKYRQQAQSLLKEKEKDNNQSGGNKIADKKRKSSKEKRAKRTANTEYEFVEVTKESIERKRKAAAKSIKAKRRSLRTEKSKTQKANKGRSCSENLSTNAEI